MKKVKIYLDTSVISHLSAEDVPDKMNDTSILWELIKQNKITAVISNITLEEIEKCPEPKRSLLYNFLTEIEFEQIAENDESVSIASAI